MLERVPLGELDGGDVKTGGIEGAEETFVGDVGSGVDVVQPTIASVARPETTTS